MNSTLEMLGGPDYDQRGWGHARNGQREAHDRAAGQRRRRSRRGADGPDLRAGWAASTGRSSGSVAGHALGYRPVVPEVRQAGIDEVIRRVSTIEARRIRGLSRRTEARAPTDP